jgi:HTH-type transcriptional regulator / antitoxin HigA
MTIKPIKNEKDYEIALRKLEKVFDAKPNTKEGDETDILGLLIENYENQKYVIVPPDPIEAIKIRMEEMNLKQKDLIGVIGGKSRVSDVLNKKRKLTVEMIRNLADKLNLSASLLVKEYNLSH